MITLLDGSLGQELVRRSGKTPTPLWSTSVMLDHPELVEGVHRDYFASGALIATTNTYAIHRDRLKPQGMEHQFETLHQTAIDIASRARDIHGAGFIGGSLGPLVASYRPDLCPPAEEAAELYAEIATIHGPHVDLFLLETMASIDQARGAVMGASVVGKPIWLALTVKDEDGTQLRSGETIAEAMEALSDLPIDAVLLNCSVPEAIDAGLPQVAHKRTGAYANGFTHITSEIARPGGTVQDLRARQDLDPVAHTAFARHWRDKGATILGGCCEIGPTHMAHLRDALIADGTELATTLHP